MRTRPGYAHPDSFGGDMRKSITTTLAALSVLMASAGCSSAAEVEAPPTTASKRSASAKPTPTPTPVIDDYAACGKFGGRLDDTLTVVEQIVADGTGSTLDWDLLDDVATDLHAAEDTASPKMQGYLAPYSGVVFTLEAIRAGTMSSSQNLDTGAYRDSVAPLLSYCVEDIGWTVDG